MRIDHAMPKRSGRRRGAGVARFPLGCAPEVAVYRVGLLRWYFENHLRGNPEEIAIAREEARHLLRALSLRKRRVLFLTVGCGYGAAAVARMGNLPQRTVAHWARTALEQIGRK